MLLGNSNGEQLESGVGGLNVSDGSGGEGGVQLKKGPWTAAEDAILTEYVRKHGEGNWNAVQRNTGLARCGKSCRLRWANHLRPNLKKGAFSPEEERLIVELHAQLGNKWARMAAQVHKYIFIIMHIILFRVLCIQNRIFFFSFSFSDFVFSICTETNFCCHFAPFPVFLVSYSDSYREEQTMKSRITGTQE